MAREMQQIDRFVRAAAFLRREFLGRSIVAETSLSLREKTIYFFDTDIIVTYCQPWLMGSRQKGSREGNVGYGEIFPTIGSNISDPERRRSKDDRAAHIAAILAEYVFTEVRPNNLPAYQFNDHFDETRRIYEENARRFASLAAGRQKTMSLAQEERIRRAAALVAAYRPNTEGALGLFPMVEFLLQQMTPLDFPVKLEDRRIQSWERFLRLNAVTGGIYPGSLASDHFARDGDKKIVNALRLLNGELTPQETNIFNTLTIRIANKLRDSDSFEYANAERDARAVASLYLLNVRLKGTGWRAQFVTGARSLIEACYEKFPDAEGIDLEIADSFSQKYVRHLWAYTTEALLEPDWEGRRKFINWLDGLLASEAASTDFDEGHLTEIVKGQKTIEIENRLKLKAGTSSVVAEALNEWEVLTEKAVSKHRFEALGINSDEALRLQHRIVGKIARWQEGSLSRSWQDITDELGEEYHRAKDRTFLDFSRIGNNAIFRAQGIGQRNPPDLAFGSLSNTNKIFRRLCDANPYDQEEFANDFKEIESDCHDSSVDGDDRQLSHLRFLVLGATFAGANKWGVALSQGKRAVSIIERSRKFPYWPIPVKTQLPGLPVSFMSGREAYFLCAAATRVVARTRHDLDSSLLLLEQAEKCLAEDQAQTTAARTTHVRFKCERLALVLSEYYLERKNLNIQNSNNYDASDKFQTPNNNEYCDDLVPPIYAAAHLMLKEVRKNEPSHKAFSDPKSNLKRFGRVTLVHIATNVVQCCVIRAFRRLNLRTDRSAFTFNREDLRQALRLMAHFAHPPLGRERDELRQTPLMRLYRDAGARILAEDEFHFEKTQSALNELFKKESSQNVAVYDDWRFERLKDLGAMLNHMAHDELQDLVFE
jgi:hypothetical protein